MIIYFCKYIHFVKSERNITNLKKYLGSPETDQRTGLYNICSNIRAFSTVLSRQ